MSIAYDRAMALIPDPALPGADLVTAGLEDLHAGRETEASLLVQMAAPRLRALGYDVAEPPAGTPPAGHRLFAHLEEQLGAGAHSRYNALLRRIVSFASAADHASSR